MKQIATDYSYSPSTNVVTLNNLLIYSDQLLLITAPEVSRTLYNFATGPTAGVVTSGSNTRITLNSSTAGLVTTSGLIIYYDDNVDSSISRSYGQSSTGAIHPLLVGEGYQDFVNSAGSGRLAVEPIDQNGLSLVDTDTVSLKTKLINSVTISSLPAISGTVTANVFGTNGYANIKLNMGDGNEAFQNGARVGVAIIDDEGNEFGRAGGSPFLVQGTVTVGNSVTIGALPRPTWTDYSGTIVTAGTAVTAISTTTRSYLLAQVTTGQMFINIGATATTLNSVYFSAGQGFAWETSVPQGIVSIISAVTGTNYVLKDG